MGDGAVPQRLRDSPPTFPLVTAVDAGQNMTLNELKGKYARLSHEIDELAASGQRHEGRLMRLLNDLDQVHQELSALRRRTLSAPTLRDEVQAAAAPAVSRAVIVPLVPAAAAPQRQPLVAAQLSLAG